MTGELPTNACRALRQHFLQVALDNQPASAELQRHLAACPRCAAELAKSRAAVALLEEALRPEMPTSAFLHRLRSSAGTVRPIVSHARHPRILRFVTTAAAAVLLAALYLPTWRNQGSNGRQLDEGAALSGQDVSAIVSSYALLRWENPLLPDTEALRAEVDALDARISAQGARLLPWNPEDDWDMPAQNEERSHNSRPPVELAAVRTLRGAPQPDHGAI